ncbi:GntR family transcriptional regulator [Butyrivibrio sp. FC2001]|uniref:GntR family transcriptional regulator n=1 Tax=Butyrivibrio sp. FC2001 TaxID=1280671 RepID=UPI0003FB6CE9|nr:GntR family transcriptional regulator [Butyrivibrio sp. FC2001]
MVIEIDFNSDEAIYVQLCNQIIMGIATSQFREGEQLPSVRQLADMIGINMHTVNKAYSILQQEGFVKIDRRRGAIIAIDLNKLEALEEAHDMLSVVLARAMCKGVTKEEIHEMVDRIYGGYGM